MLYSVLHTWEFGLVGPSCMPYTLSNAD